MEMTMMIGGGTGSACKCSGQLLLTFASRLSSGGFLRWSPLSSSPILSSVEGRRLSLTTSSQQAFPINDDDYVTASSSSGHEATGTAAADPDPSFTIKKKAAELSPVLKGTCVFLVGMNCSIKSNLGKLLADALRYYYFDSDSLVEEVAGGKSTPRLLIDNDEEGGFRESETEVLKQLSSMGRLIVCAGNGAVQSTSNLALLRHGISVWVDVPLDMVAREIIQLPTSDAATCGSYSEVLTQLSRLYGKSLSGYAASDSTVSLLRVASKLGYEDLAQVTVEDMALEVLRKLEKLTRVKKMMEAAARPF